MFPVSPLPMLMVSTSYPKDATDWRGLFIKHLAEALAARTDINLKLWSPPGELPAAVESACTPAETAWLGQLMASGGIAHILRSGGAARLFIPLKLLILLRKIYKRSPQARLFHVNWLQNALPLWKLPGQQPALISVLGADMGLLRLPGMRLLLRQILKQRRCILAPNAEWMVAPLREFFGDAAEIRAIPFGIDHRWYALSRERRSEPDKWLTVSRLTKKKIGPLFSWGEAHFRNKHELHLFGPMQETLDIPDWVSYHGPTHPKELLEKWFPAAAGLITLSCHDEGRPQVMLEAMAAGLPIIASHLPAHDNLLIHQQTGWLTDSPEDFATALSWLSAPNHNEMLGNQARAWVKQHIGTWTDCADRYVAAYRTLLASETTV